MIEVRHGDPVGAGGCEVRCLADDDAAAARGRVVATGFEVVAFACSLSGRVESAVLVGDGLSEQIAARHPVVATATRGRVLASMDRATLCACDVATLVGTPQHVVEAEMEALVGAGLVTAHEQAGMVFHGLTEAGREVLGSLVEDSDTTSSADSAEGWV